MSGQSGRTRVGSPGVATSERPGRAGSTAVSGAERRGMKVDDRATCAPSHVRLAGDEGAALIEAAMITPVFMLILFGVLEFGAAFRDYLTLSNTVTAATRQEAIQGSNMQADWLTLQSIKKASGAFSLGDINYIVVWKASGPKDTVPTACKTAGNTQGTVAAPTNGSCNRFTPADVNAVNGATWTCSSPNPIQY